MNEMHVALDKAGVTNELVDPLKEEGKKMPHCFVAEERSDPIAKAAFQKIIDFLNKTTMEKS